MKTILAALFCLATAACAIPAQKLADGRTKVPRSFYLPPAGLDSLPLPLVDTAVYYRLAFSVAYSPTKSWIDTNRDAYYDLHLKFYGGGKLSWFMVEKTDYSPRTFDPAFGGTRGAVWRGPKTDTIEGRMFVQVSGLGDHDYEKIEIYRRGGYLVVYRRHVGTEYYFTTQDSGFYPRMPFPSW